MSKDAEKCAFCGKWIAADEWSHTEERCLTYLRDRLAQSLRKQRVLVEACEMGAPGFNGPNTLRVIALSSGLTAASIEYLRAKADAEDRALKTAKGKV